MIRKEDVTVIGSFTKTHGIKGELNMVLQNDLFDTVDPDYVICNIDGIYVPFFIDSYRFKTDDSLFIKLEDVDDDVAAEKFVKFEVYLDKKQVGHLSTDEVNHYSWVAFIGYEVFDQNGSLVGKIVDVDESTMNTLLSIDHQGQEVLIPIQEELLEWIDDTKKQMQVRIPEGLLSLL